MEAERCVAGNSKWGALTRGGFCQLSVTEGMRDLGYVQGVTNAGKEGGCGWLRDAEKVGGWWTGGRGGQRLTGALGEVSCKVGGGERCSRLEVSELRDDRGDGWLRQDGGQDCWERGDPGTEKWGCGKSPRFRQGE